tara:strand:+ start:381 stop:1118 length:738 start_codon:yes stop_codon:yes gene_type:complete
MNVAIFLYGEYRQFELAVEIYKDKFNFFNTDYYVSSWDYSRERCELRTYDVEHFVTEDKIKKYLPNALISLRKDKDRVGRFTTKIYQHLSICVDMCKNTRKKYDMVIVKRIDGFEIFDNSLFDNVDSNSLYTMNGLSDGVKFDFGDLFFYGGVEPVFQFIKGFYKKIELGLLANVHGHPDEFLYESDISVKKFPIKVNSCLIRPNMLDIFRNCKSYGDIDKNILDANSKATSEWYDKLRKTISKV